MPGDGAIAGKHDNGYTGLQNSKAVTSPELSLSRRQLRTTASKGSIRGKLKRSGIVIDSQTRYPFAQAILQRHYKGRL
jgi:hypothetical protein